MRQVWFKEKSLNNKITIMINIYSALNENKKEAINLVKKFGTNERIDFAPIVKGKFGNDVLEDDSIFEEKEFPYVVVPFDDGLMDLAVISVKVTDGEKPSISFLLYDNIAGETLGWCDSCECISFIDNNVYTYLDELFNK